MDSNLLELQPVKRDSKLASRLLPGVFFWREILR